MDYKYTSRQQDYSSGYTSTDSSCFGYDRLAESNRPDRSYNTPEKTRPHNLSQTLGAGSSSQYRNSPLAQRIQELSSSSYSRNGAENNSLFHSKKLDNSGYNSSKTSDYAYSSARTNSPLRDTMNLTQTRQPTSSAFSKVTASKSPTPGGYRQKVEEILNRPKFTKPAFDLRETYSPSSSQVHNSFSNSAKKPPLPPSAGKQSGFEKMSSSGIFASNSVDNLRATTSSITPLKSAFGKQTKADTSFRNSDAGQNLYKSVNFGLNQASTTDQKPFRLDLPKQYDSGRAYSKSGQSTKRDRSSNDMKDEVRSREVAELLAKYSDDSKYQDKESADNLGKTYSSITASSTVPSSALDSPYRSTILQKSNSSLSNTITSSPLRKQISQNEQSSFAKGSVKSSFHTNDRTDSRKNSWNMDDSYRMTAPSIQITPPMNGSLSKADFQIGKCLGDGKFGKVYPARDKRTGCLYALKQIAKENIKKYMMEQQMVLEIKLQLYFDHPNIVKLFGYWADSTNIYLLLEYMEQGTLFSYLKKQKNEGIPEKLCSRWMKDICSAVYYMHDRDIVHRDIKPENIVLSNGTAKLCDFGWANRTNARRSTCCGTFDYASPEVLEGKDYDQNVDLWALGVLTFELLTGKLPFYSISRSQTMKNVLGVDNKQIEFPPKMSWKAKQFIESLLKKNPDARAQADMLLKHPFLSEEQETNVL